MQRAFLFLGIAAWALLGPAAWLLCQQHSCRQHDEGPWPPQLPAPVLPVWARDVVRAVEHSLRDAADADPAAAGPLAAELAMLVRTRLAKKMPVAAEAPPLESKIGGGQPALKQPDTTPEECASRGPLVVTPQQDLGIPVLDNLGGKVKLGQDTSPSNVTGKIKPSPANRWGIPMANVTVEVAKGRVLTVDEIVYGYDLLFEAMHLFSYVSWGRVAMQQDPNDALIIADLLGRVQPDCFVELGTNTGGGAVFYAEVMRGYLPQAMVVTVDVHDPKLNWDRFAKTACPQCLPVTCHPTWREPGLIKFVQGYTQEPRVIDEVDRLLKERQCKRTVVMHDADHRRATVLEDLRVYHRFVPLGSYLIVQDTKLSRMRGGRYSTLEAVEDFLASEGRGRFVIDKTFEYLLFSHHHNGFMQRVA
mmetsp:Transcript_45587/g.90393  ORF Transcript_45587/g.90393 Transcript_45587/m.90393 type:complete len:418 (+) Transcript_45587:130-1383(+)